MFRRSTAQPYRAGGRVDLARLSRDLRWSVLYPYPCLDAIPWTSASAHFVLRCRADSDRRPFQSGALRSVMGFRIGENLINKKDLCGFFVISGQLSVVSRQ